MSLIFRHLALRLQGLFASVAVVLSIGLAMMIMLMVFALAAILTILKKYY